MIRWQTIYEARWILAVLLVPLLLGLYYRYYLVGKAVLVLGVGLLLFVLWFFRDPDRPVPSDESLVASPADGVVADIKEMDEPEVTKKPSLRVGIFLSVFDVHTNKMPLPGKIVHSQRHEGHFYDARDPKASELNECWTWGVETQRAGIVVMRQITGLIARRIVPWAKVGDTLAKGERFGMIRFGSRTEIYLPPGTELTVKVGDKVKGAETVIARLK
ncbi:MAG: phosphatidylserine decarboxylase family protein [Verrucomicrobia bacterium]|nr:phosphatidylserine decarboxylase family protein [Verrucomicrobiota bacterium]